jgi:hypothetical protein
MPKDSAKAEQGDAAQAAEQVYQPPQPGPTPVPEDKPTCAATKRTKDSGEGGKKKQVKVPERKLEDLKQFYMSYTLVELPETTVLQGDALKYQTLESIDPFLWNNFPHLDKPGECRFDDFNDCIPHVVLWEQLASFLQDRLRNNPDPNMRYDAQTWRKHIRGSRSGTLRMVPFGSTGQGNDDLGKGCEDSLRLVTNREGSPWRSALGVKSTVHSLFMRFATILESYTHWTS